MILSNMDKKEEMKKQILTYRENEFKIKSAKAQIEQKHTAKVEEEK